MLWQCIRNLLVFQVEKVLDFTSFLGRFDHRGDLFIDRWTESKFCKELFTVFQLHCSDRIQILALYQSSVCSFGCQGHGIVLFMIICNLNFDQMEGLQNKSWKGKDEETRDDRHKSSRKRAGKVFLRKTSWLAMQYEKNRVGGRA